MKTKSPFSWNILLISLGCFLFTIHSSSGMFGEEFDQAKADEAARLKAQQQAEQQQRGRELTDPDNQQVSGSSALDRGNLSNSNGPSEKNPEKAEQEAQDQMIRIITRSYFSSFTQEEENRLVNEMAAKLLYHKMFCLSHNRNFTPDDAIFYVTASIAKIADVARPATVAEAVAAYHQAVAQLGSRLGLEGRPTEEIVEISSRLREYELEAMMFDDPQLTEEGRINFAARIVAKIDARKSAAAQPPTASTATVTHLAASAKFIEINAELEEYESFLRSIGDPPLTKQQRADFTTQFTSNVAVKKKAAQQQTTQPSVKAAAVSLSAPVKAAATLPPQPPQESAFERKKNETLRNLREQIATAQRELPIHQATQERLQKEWATHEGRVRQTDLDLENFKAINPFTGSGLRFGFTEHSRQLLDQKDRLETACINAVRSRNQFVATTKNTLENAKRSITTISSRIQSLEGEHARVAASEDPVIVEKRRQEEAAARAIALEQQRQRQQQEAAARALTREQRRQQEIEEGKIAGLAQRKAIEAQLAAERAKALAQQQRATALTATYHSPSEEAKRLSDHSNGSTSGEESNHSTPEKMKTPLMTEIERLEEGVRKIHAAVVNTRDAINTAKSINKEFWQHWDRYFELAQQRSELKQRLATLKGNTPEPAFKASDKKPLRTWYSDALLEKERFFEDLYRTYFGSTFTNIYKRHSIHSMDDYHRNGEVQELEEPLIQRLQKERQQVAMRLLQAELALVAAEEHPSILQQIEECVWQNMPELSEKDRERAIRRASDEHKNDLAEERIALKYSGVSSPAASSATSYAPNPYGLQYQQACYQRLNQQQQGFNNWQAVNQVSFRYDQMRISSNNYSYK